MNKKLFVNIISGIFKLIFSGKFIPGRIFLIKKNFLYKYTEN